MAKRGRRHCKGLPPQTARIVKLYIETHGTLSLAQMSIRLGCHRSWVKDCLTKAVTRLGLAGPNGEIDRRQILFAAARAGLITEEQANQARVWGKKPEGAERVVR